MPEPRCSTATRHTTCPSWCDQRTAGHDYDSLTKDGQGEARNHSAAVGSVRVDDDPQQEVFVDVTSLEEVQVGPDGVETQSEPPRIALTAEYVQLTRTQALRVAQLLLTAADRLGAIQ